MYLYGVIRASDHPKLPRRGVESLLPGRVEHGELAAIAGPAPEGRLRASRRNVMAHMRVLQEIVAASCDVLPFRFGVVAEDEDAVREQLLEAHADTLAAHLARLAGHVELGVTVTCPEEALVRWIADSDPRLARLAAGTYADRLRAGEQIAARVGAAQADMAQRAHAALGALAADAVDDEPRHEDMLANVAFLLERTRVSRFEGELERLSASLPAEMGVRCVGPVPPFHFVELELPQGDPAWA